MKKHKNIGDSFDSFLEEQGIEEEVTGSAIKQVIAWQIENNMRENNISKSAMAKKMNTSRSALDRLLDPKNTAVTLQTLMKAANAVGKKLVFKLA